jgi:hypothetical protein
MKLDQDTRKLSATEKRSILAGQHPAIVRAEKGDKGTEIVLRTTRTPIGPIPQVVVTITGWRKLKRGGYKARYSVQDDRRLYLNRGLGYTRSPSRALDTEAPVLDEETAQRFAMEGEQKIAILGAKQRQKHKAEDEGAEHKAGRGKQAREYAARAKRLETA